MIKAIIFDADKTLYTIMTKNAYEALYTYISKETGDTPQNIRIKHKKLIDSIKKESDPKKRSYSYTISILLKEYKKDTKDIILKALDTFWKNIIEDLKETPTTIKTISELKENYTLAIASDEFIINLEKKIEHIFGSKTGPFSYFITPEDTGTMKPSEKYYEIALKKLKIKPNEAIVVGDSYERDLKPAKLHGITTVLLGATYDNKPDHHIKKMIELKKIIQKCED